MTFENDAILLFDSDRGVYIPHHFATQISRDCISSSSGNEIELIKSLDALAEGIDGDDYWDEWCYVEDYAQVTMPEYPGIKYRLYMDGDLWLVPEDCLTPHDDDCLDGTQTIYSIGPITKS